LQKFKLARWGDEVESYFDAQCGGLDRVVLSILQVVDGSIAQELFFRIQSGEQSFAEIALDYSQGVHAQNAGILGPLESRAEIAESHSTRAVARSFEQIEIVR
jgi:hypothetical protein